MTAANLEPHSDYERWVGRLYRTPLFHPTNQPSLENMRKLYDLVGKPMDDPNIEVIHVAGTNGKGSVCLKIANVLQKLNCYEMVGLYSSPHLSCFRERIQIDGDLITEEETAQHLAYTYQLCQQHNIPATFFEIVTLVAFLSFRNHHDNHLQEIGGEDDQKQQENNGNSKKKSVVVLEVGLGGRLDATNVIENPSKLSIITSIGLDHTSILGDTCEKIALEKAGIIKPNSGPVLVGHRTPIQLLRQYAMDLGIQEFYTVNGIHPLLPLGGQPPEENNNNNNNNNSHDNDNDNDNDATSSSSLNYDADNTRLASAAITLLLQNVKGNLTQQPRWSSTPPSGELLTKWVSVRPACRFETISLRNDKYQKDVTIILDVAHNPIAMEALVNRLLLLLDQKEGGEGCNNNGCGRRFRFVMGMSKDKDWRGILRALFPPLSTSDGIDYSSSRKLAIFKLHLVQAAHSKAMPLTKLIQDIRQESDVLLPRPNHKSTGSPLEILEYDLKYPTVKNQIDKACLAAAGGHSTGGEEVVVICGSVFLMAEARHALGIKESRDSDYLVELSNGGGNNNPRVLEFGNGENFPTLS